MSEWHLARGYRFAGIHCGLRPDPARLDLALVVSDSPAAAAGVFTQNCVVAAPVQVCRERLPARNTRGIVICSGNANACTGDKGISDARRMTEVAAQAIGCQVGEMLVCSTGVIGHRLPMPVIETGIRTAASKLATGAQALDHVAHAIMTTDTRIKVSTQSVKTNGIEFRVTGFAKGAAMIGPNMATMLAFVLSDASVPAEHLSELSRRAAAETFNCISVEGHTSTNDTLLFLANGLENPLQSDALVAFDRAAMSVCAELARAIAADAEGASHLVTIKVEGLLDDGEARRVAKVVAESALVKTAIFGADPNWGRIVSAAGYAGVTFAERNLSLWIGDMLLYHAGTPQPFDYEAASAYLKNNREVVLRLRFDFGTGRCVYHSCDLGYEYIRLNAEYTT